ncbi:hypothetical protein [Aeromonas veronii]|uniref:hypothetical protein n=1 Tax=Aeromonas veronii TaxID=654 RepID=UPI003D1DA861
MQLSLKCLLILSVILTVFVPLRLQAADVLCGGEPMPVLPDRYLVCAMDLGIEPNTGMDISPILGQVMPQHRGIFFPAGKYIVSNGIVLGSENSLIGSESGITIFHNPDAERSASIGNSEYTQTVKKLTIRGLILDNIIINFYGHKDAIEIANNAFINTISEGPQISVSHNKFSILGNVLLRDKMHPGLGLSTYRNIDTLIYGNIVGSISDGNVIATLNYYDANSYNMVAKLKQAAEVGDIRLDAAQDYYKSAWYATDGLTGSTFQKNVIFGNEENCLKANAETNECLIGRDHVTYIKQYKDVNVINNYYNGWPKDASGSVKFRNATGLFFSGNYLDRVQFDARPYDHSPVLNMDNTFIFNNFLNETSVTYWQNFTDSEDFYINAKNFVVFDNVFEGDDKNAARIYSTWRSTHGEFLESNNLYPDSTPVLTQSFVSIDIAEAKSRLPEDKTNLLDLKPIPLWHNIGQITGPELTENNLVRIDIKMKGSPDQFLVYAPPSSYYYPSFRWAPRLAQNINSTLKGVCAGELTDNVITDNHCKFMKPIASGYKNILYATTGLPTTYALSIVEKYKKVGAIFASSDLKIGQTVRFHVRFEDGTENEIEYTPNEYMLPAHRWPMGLAIEINKRIPGLCAGIYNGEKNNTTEEAQCLNVEPAPSGYQNKVYTINGQSAVTTMDIIETGF